jgi:hypothetical protein
VRVATAATAAVALAACLLSGCSSGGSGPAESTQTPTTTARKIVSTVIDLTLPPGTTISSHSDGVEIWQTPGSQQDAVAALKPQVPIGTDLKGAKWCGEHTDAKSGQLDWLWAGPNGSVNVEIGTDGVVRIEKTLGAATCTP